VLQGALEVIPGVVMHQRRSVPAISKILAHTKGRTLIMGAGIGEPPAPKS